jgi:hypothetical protein
MGRGSHHRVTAAALNFFASVPIRGPFPPSVRLLPRTLSVRLGVGFLPIPGHLWLISRPPAELTQPLGPVPIRVLRQEPRSRSANEHAMDGPRALLNALRNPDRSSHGLGQATRAHGTLIAGGDNRLEASQARGRSPILKGAGYASERMGSIGSLLGVVRFEQCGSHAPLRYNLDVAVETVSPGESIRETFSCG